jgi:hypothetical protein
MALSDSSCVETESAAGRYGDTGGADGASAGGGVVKRGDVPFSRAPLGETLRARDGKDAVFRELVGVVVTTMADAETCGSSRSGGEGIGEGDAPRGSERTGAEARRGRDDEATT